MENNTRNGKPFISPKIIGERMQKDVDLILQGLEDLFAMEEQSDETHINVDLVLQSGTDHKTHDGVSVSYSHTSQQQTKREHAAVHPHKTHNKNVSERTAHEQVATQPKKETVRKESFSEWIVTKVDELFYVLFRPLEY